MLFPQDQIDCKGRLLDLSRPKVMGILNLTPDSFFDGNRYRQVDQALVQTEKMLSVGADLIDIGGMSSRPGAKLLSPEEEQKRVLPVIEHIVQRFPQAILSIDTVRSEVAKSAVERGVHIVNDISAGRFDEQMYPTVGALGVPYILMHMQGRPETMQVQPAYPGGVVQEVQDFLAFEMKKLRDHGVLDIIVDPGFGFGKRLEDNYELLQQLDTFRILGVPILAGISRKGMIYKLLDKTPETALNGTTAMNMVALQKGARLLRVHDVAEAVEVIRLWESLEDPSAIRQGKAS